MVSEQALQSVLGQPDTRGNVWVKWRLKGDIARFDVNLCNGECEVLLQAADRPLLIQRSSHSLTVFRLLASLGCVPSDGPTFITD